VSFAQVRDNLRVVMTHDAEWAKALHQRIAKAIRDARQGRLTAQELADETERLGYPITRSQIANYESGRKQSLDVCELIVIAAALRVPPLKLMFADAQDQTVEMLPGQPTSTFDAISRFIGNPIWPREEAAELTKKLDSIKRAIDRSAGLTGKGILTATAVPVIPQNEEKTL
jgi:transcriptional regulator with XRE-family HTH domain